MIQISVEINRPLNTVWDFFIEPANWKKWNNSEIREVKPGWEQGAQIHWALGGPSIIKRFVDCSEIEIAGFVSDTKYNFMKKGEDRTIIEITISDPKGGMIYTDGGAAEKNKNAAALGNLKSLIEKETTSLSKNKSVQDSSRTIRDFEVNQPIWSFVDKWSGKYGLKLAEAGPDTRLYKKGNPALKAPLWVEISYRNSRVHLEAWLSVDDFTRKYYKFSTLFILRLKPEYGIESGGNFARIPKKQYRQELNELLIFFGQPPIE